MITRPVRERPADQVRSMIRAGLERTGYDEVALTSLSTADFSSIEDTVRGGGRRASAATSRCRSACPASGSTPSPWRRPPQIAQPAALASPSPPRAGTWRMRRVINKLITEEDLYGAVDAAFSNGWRRVKLYFLIGLPTERDEDVLGIAELGPPLRRDRALATTVAPTVVASVGGFVPKPQTPFQWFGQDTGGRAPPQGEPAEGRLPRRARASRCAGTTPRRAVVEGLASRGDRRMGAVIERVWRAGGTFQEWSERFDLVAVGGGAGRRGALARGAWSTATATRTRSCPWDHLSAGLHRDFLWSDWQDALAVGGGRGLPLDPLLRLRRLHRRRAGARRGVGDCRRPVGARGPARTCRWGTGCRSAS